MNARNVAFCTCLPLLALATHGSMGCASNDAASPGFEPDAGDAAPSTETDAGFVEDARSDSPVPDRDGGPPCNEDGWCRTPLPGVPSPSLKGVFAVSPTRALATGETCAIQGSQYVCATSLLLWDGNAWSTAARGLERLTGIWASDADHFWVVNDQSKSIARVTFDGNHADIATESLPYDLKSCADAKLAISGSGPTGVYVAAYCYNGDQTTKGFLFHRTEGDGGAPAWSTTWSGGGTSELQAGLGSVFVSPSGDVWAAGWKIQGPTGSWSARSYIPDTMSTLVLRVTGDTVDEQALDPSLAMCSQSIWSAGDGTVFVGGVCDSGYLDYTEYPTLARYGQLADGGFGWSAVHRTPIGQWGAIGRSFPVVWGFGSTEVYAVGSWATVWNGTALETVNLAVNGSPVGNRVESVHGSSSTDIWMVGNGFAMHRAR